jgi:outer membrane protein OmpA-like peptidoglycan-associated protein
MFPSRKAGIVVRSLGLTIGVAGTLLVTAPGASAQTPTDIIRSLAPIDHGPSAPPPGRVPGPGPGFDPDDGPPPGPPGFRPGPGPGPGAGPGFGPPPRPGFGPGPGRPGFGPGPGIEDTDVDFDGQRSHAYIDYSHSIDLTVYFDYNSAHVGERAREMLDRLGQALDSPELRGFRFLIAGHTDAVGSDDANADLSWRRAKAVREYLMHAYRVPPGRLAVKGWGRSRLKDPSHPESGINRRVEVALIVDRGPPPPPPPGDGAYGPGPGPGPGPAPFRGPPRPGDEQAYGPGPGPGPVPVQGPRQWFQCPPGSHLIDPRRPNMNLDDFGGGAEKPMCRPDDDRAPPPPDDKGPPPDDKAPPPDQPPPDENKAGR